MSIEKDGREKRGWLPPTCAHTGFVTSTTPKSLGQTKGLVACPRLEAKTYIMGDGGRRLDCLPDFFPRHAEVLLFSLQGRPRRVEMLRPSLFIHVSITPALLHGHFSPRGESNVSRACYCLSKNPAAACLYVFPPRQSKKNIPSRTSPFQCCRVCRRRRQHASRCWRSPSLASLSLLLALYRKIEHTFPLCLH